MLFTTAAPFHDLRLSGDISFQLAPGTSFAPIPDWIRNDEAVKQFSQLDQNALAICTHCFLSEYEAETTEFLVVQKGELSVIGRKSDEVFLANVAMWLQRLPSIGFTFVFHSREGFNEAWRHDRFLYHSDDNGYKRKATLEDLNSVRALFGALLTIPRHSAPWAAFRALSAALQMQRNEIRHLLLWIALEALFGGADGEIKYRLSQRLAFFAAKDRSEANNIFLKAKKGYDARCKIAHGGWGAATLNSEKNAELTGVTEELLRRAFIRLLQDMEVLARFTGSDKKRCEYLDQLPFGEFISDQSSVPPTNSVPFTTT